MGPDTLQLVCLFHSFIIVSENGTVFKSSKRMYGRNVCYITLPYKYVLPCQLVSQCFVSTQRREKTREAVRGPLPNPLAFFSSSLCASFRVAPATKTLRDLFISWGVTLGKYSCNLCRNRIARLKLQEKLPSLK